MSQRLIKVNNMLREELSKILRNDYQAESVMITIVKVKTSPDLRNACVFYSVVGGGLQEREAAFFLKRARGDIRFRLGKRVVLKYLPSLRFILDKSIEKSMDLLDRMDHIDEEEAE